MPVGSDLGGTSARHKCRTEEQGACVLEKSDCAMVPVNQPNKAAQAAAEVEEGRVQPEENIG
jgi:hypothetical protein